MNYTPSELPTRERVWERVGSGRKIINAIQERFGKTVSSAAVSNWKTRRNNTPVEYYMLLAEMAELPLEVFYEALHPNCRGLK